jgi:hypothetical protein
VFVNRLPENILSAGAGAIFLPDSIAIQDTTYLAPPDAAAR